jgi:D-sedoheptulose 7-phosphate isomerase
MDMQFPGKNYISIAAYYDDYADALSRAHASVDRKRLDAAASLLTASLQRDASVYACGNGGSASIANHLACDHTKGIGTDTGLRPRVHSLSTAIELMTAIANDISFADVFAFQVKTVARPGDVLITISSSGDSENIFRAVQAAKERGMSTIALTGFTGGRSAHLADINLHVEAANYGIVEDTHQSIMHCLAQFIRQTHMPADLVGSRKF